jgi:cell division protein FtsB
VTAPPAPATEKRRAAPARSRTAAAQRAYARRAQREGRRIEPPVEEDLDRGTGRASFVVLIIVVLTVGVASTLWLSTQAIADSYRLEQAKAEADRLSERAAELQREVTEKESAASLAERAKAMGMIPSGDPARLIVQPDGTVVVVGEPTPVQPPAPPADQTQPPAGQTQPPAGQNQPGTTGGQPPGGTGQGAG